MIVTTLSTQVAQKRAWPHGTSAMPSRCPIRHTWHQSAAAAGVAADVEVVPVAAAGNAVADGRSVVCVIFFAGGLVMARLQSVSVRCDSRRVGTECACTIRSRTVKSMVWCVARSSDSFSSSVVWCWDHHSVSQAMSCMDSVVTCCKWRKVKRLKEHKRVEWHEVDDDEAKRWKNDAIAMNMKTSGKWKRCIVKGKVELRNNDENLRGWKSETETTMKI